MKGTAGAGLPERATRICMAMRDRLLALSPQGIPRSLWLIIAASLALKLLNAYHHYGFYCGDDVEIQEMSFARLFHWTSWRAWELRSPFYPLIFIYPAQWLVLHVGFRDAAALVFAGRVVVTLFSTLNILLTYHLARTWTRSPGVAYLAALILATSHLHTIFAASELPRTVSSTFVLASALGLSWRVGSMTSLIAGLAVSIAACIRFSEALFVLPALWFLLGDRRRRDALVFLAAASAGCALILGIGDLLYWGEPFHSLRKIVDYTLIRGESSRGYQSPLEYLVHLGRWTNLAILGLAVAGARRAPRHLVVWPGAAILILSLLPHKEARYLVPALPFVSILAAVGLWNLLNRISAMSSPAAGTRRFHGAILLVCLIGALLFEAGASRFRRSEFAVDVARRVATPPHAGGVAFEQSWRGGGGLYLHGVTPFAEISTERADDSTYVRTVVAEPEIAWVAMRSGSLEKHDYRSMLEGLGYVKVDLNERRRRVDYGLFYRPARRGETPE